MFRYVIVSSTGEVGYASTEKYKTQREAEKNGYEHLDAWEAINGLHGTVNTFEVK